MNSLCRHFLWQLPILFIFCVRIEVSNYLERSLLETAALKSDKQLAVWIVMV